MKIKKYINFLMATPIFDGVDRAKVFSLLESRTYTKNFSKDEIIYLQNEKAKTMDIILKGEVIIQNIDGKGNVLSIASLGKGDMLGGNLIFSSNNEYPMTITGKSEVELLSLDRETILLLSQKDRRFLSNLLGLFSDKALVLTSKIHSLARKTIREKIMDFLVFESNYQNSKNVYLNITKKELAERFGVPRPSLQRELRKMKDEGLIDFDSRKIVLK